LTTDAAHHRVWHTAHVYFGTSLIIGLTLNYYSALNFGIFSGSIILHMIGAPLLVIGSLIIISAKQALERHEQPSEPGSATTAIVDSGMFHYSRNPLYTGLAICYCGLAFAIDNLWLLILLPFTLVIVQVVLIAPEERYLEKKFANEYLAYKKRTRRWL